MSALHLLSHELPGRHRLLDLCADLSWVPKEGDDPMAVYKRGDIWWYKFMWRGEYIRESTKQGNRRVAEQMEAAKKTQLAKGEVGIREHTVAPTLGLFAEKIFIPAIETEKCGKPKTVKFYKERVARMKTFPRLWGARLDRITPDDLTAYVNARQLLGLQISTINRDLATLRRMFNVAMRDKHVATLLPKIKLQPGENQRERVVLPEEESAYLDVAAPLLKDFAELEFDCGLRPEEAHGLKWTQIRNGNVEIHKGKQKQHDGAFRRHRACWQCS